MRIDELLLDERRDVRWPSPESDALTEEGALVEAALLDVRLDQVYSDVWLLLDCRGALQIEEANTAVVVVRGTTEFSWQSVPRVGRTWRSVMSWVPTAGSRTVRITAGVEPDGDLTIAGIGAEFYVGNIPGGDGPPPDFASASDAEMRAGMANWTAEIEIVGASFVRWSR